MRNSESGAKSIMSVERSHKGYAEVEFIRPKSWWQTEDTILPASKLKIIVVNCKVTITDDFGLEL